MSKIHEIITDRIIKALEAGTIPWHKPWRAGELPMNLISGKPYHGINVWMTIFQPFDSPYWLTYNQCRQRGGQVRKGEKGTPIVYYRLLESKTKKRADGRPETFPMMRYSTVFNVEQCDGLEYPKPKMIAHDPIPACEAVVDGWDDMPTIEHGGGRCFYSNSRDVIGMPVMGRFEKPEAYYSSVFHECGHATGHESRLDRDMSGVFGSASYSAEELVAEMTAAMLCGQCGIESKTLDDSASYIAGWLKRMKANPKLVITAASLAQKAADLIFGDKAVTPKSDSEVAPAESDSSLSQVA